MIVNTGKRVDRVQGREYFPSKCISVSYQSISSTICKSDMTSQHDPLPYF
jgi:hypothetical protein